MARVAHSPDYFWETVFLKVENTLFCVPKFHFEQTSEVFADMFSLPTTNPEGRVKEKPIVLENFKADEFTCLLKVMYPTADCSISGAAIDLRLDKAEWINVLKLSTIWNMKKVRDYAIHRLSKDVSLTPVEKIQLARAHRVSKWLEEGLAVLASADRNSTREELTSLGHRTAFDILWIQYQSLKEPSGKLFFRKDSIKCECCSSSSSLLNGNHPCRQCGANLTADELLSFTGSPPISTRSPSDRVLNLSIVQCSKCSRNAFYGLPTVSCPSCSTATYYNSNIRVTPKRPVNEQLIRDLFGAEIDSYQTTPPAAT